MLKYCSFIFLFSFIFSACTDEPNVVPTCRSNIELTYNIKASTTTNSEDGAIIVTNIENGQPPYQLAMFAQNDSSQIRKILNLQQVSAGQYQLVVEDALGCDTSFDIEIPANQIIE